MNVKSLNRRTVLWVNIALIAAVCVLNYFYQYHNFNYTLKCCASGCFALLGAVNLLWARRTRQREMRIYVLLCLGVVFAMLGDIAINPSFVAGAALFAVGHVFLVAAYCAAQPLQRRDLWFLAPPVAFALAFMLLYPHFSFPHPTFYGICIGYAVIIAVMLGKSAANFARRPRLFEGLLALGSALFFFSDFMLLLHWFVGKWSWTNHACMAAYYPAVCLMGLAMYVKTREK